MGRTKIAEEIGNDIVKTKPSRKFPPLSKSDFGHERPFFNPFHLLCGPKYPQPLDQ